MPRTTFQRSPVDIERDSIIADRLDLLQDVCPEADRGQAPGVELAGADISISANPIMLRSFRSLEESLDLLQEDSFASHEE